VQMETSPGPSATGVALTVKATVPDITAEQFAEIAENAKKNCVISRALSIPVTMSATLG
jgi:osmotically inducible protein OsmC